MKRNCFFGFLVTGLLIASLHSFFGYPQIKIQSSLCEKLPTFFPFIDIPLQINKSLDISEDLFQNIKVLYGRHTTTLKNLLTHRFKVQKITDSHVTKEGKIAFAMKTKAGKQTILYFDPIGKQIDYESKQYSIKKMDDIKCVFISPPKLTSFIQVNELDSHMGDVERNVFHRKISEYSGMIVAILSEKHNLTELVSVNEKQQRSYLYGSGIGDTTKSLNNALLIKYKQYLHPIIMNVQAHKVLTTDLIRKYASKVRT